MRAALQRDIAALQQIEVTAGESFRALGMDLVADDDPFSAEELGAYIDGNRAWVVTVDDLPVGYLVMDEVDGHWHIEQVSIDPHYAGRRLGGRLTEHLASLARGAGVRALTLTTFREVAWNAPYYERLGFHELPEAAWSTGLRALRDREAEHGLDRWPRLCMRRAV